MKQKTGRQLLSFLLTLAMLVGLMPGMGMTAYADNTETLLTTITPDSLNFANYTVADIAEVSRSNVNVKQYSLDGFYWRNPRSEKGQLTVTGKEGYTITRVVFTVIVDPSSGTTCTKEYTEAPYAVYPFESDIYPTQADQDARTNSLGLGVTKIEVYGYATPTHTHSFTYSASGATITATCGAANCGLTSNPTLTIVAPTMTVYQETGKSEVASLTGLQDFNTATGKSLAVTNIMYVGRDGTEYTESTTAPTNAGKYTATITLSGVKTAEGDDKSVAASVDYSIKYAVTFNTNGGSAVPQQLVEAGESATRPTDPTREGCIFGGWFADADFARRYVFDEVTENTTVYAKWGEHRVTWTVGEYSLQDVFTGNAPAADSNTMVNFAAEINKPEGATFEGWKTETDVSGDVTHTAQFSFPVTLNVNGGTINASNVESYIYGTGATLPTDVTRAKYDFGGWFDNSGLTGTAVTQIGTTATGSKEFWAKWTEVYAVPATVTANSRTYDGTEKPLVTVTGTATGGEMQYALGTATEATQPYTTSIPTATEAGTYHVWYKAVGDGDHADSEAACVDATIKGADPAPVVGTVEVYRTYNPKSGEHFYTASAEERDAIVALGWVDEGVGWVAPETSSTPVFRLYSGTDHHYTTSAEERDKLVALGWVDEGVACYSDDGRGTPLYRLFNPNVDPHAANNNSGSHHFTTSKAECDYLAGLGWVDEGVAWHGVAQ